VPDAPKTSTGLDSNVAAALAYGLGWITGLVFIVAEPNDRFVRFHALQSIIVFGTLSAITLLLQAVPILGMLIAVFLVVPLSAVLWLLLMYKAYQGEKFKLPIAGDMADQRL
jgi:uncharacterized membrane protein